MRLTWVTLETLSQNRKRKKKVTTKEEKRWPWKRDASQTLEVIAWVGRGTMTAAAKNPCEMVEAIVRNQVSQESPGEAQRSELAVG